MTGLTDYIVFWLEALKRCGKVKKHNVSLIIDIKHRVHFKAL